MGLKIMNSIKYWVVTFLQSVLIVIFIWGFTFSVLVIASDEGGKIRFANNTQDKSDILLYLDDKHIVEALNAGY